MDLAAVFTTYLTAIAFRTGGRIDVLDPIDPYWSVAACVAAGGLQVLFNVVFDVYWRNWNFAAIEDVIALAKSTFCAALSILALDLLTNARFIPVGAILAGGSLVLLIESALKLRPRWPQILRAAIGRSRATEKLIVVGAGRMGQLLAADLAQGDSRYRIACFVDDNRTKLGSYVRGIRVSGNVEDLADLIVEHQPAFVVIAVAAASTRLIQRVVSMCEATDTGVRRVSGFGLVHGDRTPLRTIGIDELLGREAVPLEAWNAHGYLTGETVLVTGAAGSIGGELCRRVAELGPSLLVLLDASETGLYWLEKRLEATCRVEAILGDIRDRAWLASVFETHRPSTVFHAAAYKHVPLLERAPIQGITTNVFGTANVVACCDNTNVRRLVLISTDKAVEPASVLGYTKRLAEYLVISSARTSGRGYAVVRFGNVLGSSGSAVPTFTDQIERGGPVTVTHPEATRYCMTLAEAASLVIEAGGIAESGDLLVLDMGEPVSILDLARRMITLQGLRTPSDIDIRFTGLRAGEKLHEKLFFEGEQPVGTDHPRVLRVANAESPSLASLQVVLRAMEQRAAQQDSEGALDILIRAVEGRDQDQSEVASNVVKFQRGTE